MATTAGTEQVLAQEPDYPRPTVELLETDGENLESDWHRIEISVLVESVFCYFAPRLDFYAGGNMFIYFSAEQARNRDFRGPDFFFVWGASREPLRPYWFVWEEAGRYPDVIIELLSPSTAQLDRTVKKDVYERTFHTRNYFCYDPDTRQLEGWQLIDKVYAPLVPDERGRLWCAEFGLWLGTWEGKYLGHHATWLRFFTPEGNVVLVAAEAQQQRADAAEAELTRLKAELERHRSNGPQ